MAGCRYEFNVTYKVVIPVVIETAKGRHEASKLLHRMIAEDRIKGRNENIDEVSVEYMMKIPVLSDAEMHNEYSTNVFRDTEEEEVSDED